MEGYIPPSNRLAATHDISTRSFYDEGDISQFDNSEVARDCLTFGLSELLCDYAFRYSGKDTALA